MKDAQKPDRVSLNSLVDRLREGRFVIPDFQREFEWVPADINALMRSIFLDYYIGSLLLWKSNDENRKALACENIYGYDGNGHAEHIVLDGQQRLSAMYYAFLSPNVPAPHRASRFLFFIRVDRFMQDAYEHAFITEWTRYGELLLNNDKEQYKQHMFPLAVIGKGGFALFEWMNNYEEYWKSQISHANGAGDSDYASEASQHARNARGFIEYVKEITEKYQIAYIELDKEMELDKVCDIFTQINSRGVRLDVFDLLNALLKPRGLQLKLLWREAEPRLDFVKSERLNVYVLQVMSLLRQDYCSPKYLYYLLPGQERTFRNSDGSFFRRILVPDTDDFRQLWDESVEALERATELLSHPQEYGASSSAYLPYVSILPAFAALHAAASRQPAERRLSAGRKIRSWYWASVFTNRYSGAVESTSTRDFIDVKGWFEDDTKQPGAIGEFHEGFRSLDLRREVRRGSSIYNGIFNLLVLSGAQDWSTGIVPQHGDLDDHHIVPQKRGRALGLGSEVDAVLNRTPLTSDTNRNFIRGRLPNEYIPDIIAENGEIIVQEIFRTHLISSAALQILLRDPFTPDDFEEFLSEREHTVREAIEDLLIKERLDLPLRLRELDAQIEITELQLREVIAEIVDLTSLPPHVVQKARERLQASARTKPAVDHQIPQDISGVLEYCDLRDLQDIITGKGSWPLFLGKFGTKEALSGRFNQLAALRNSVRHSRSVDEITRKDGEAALLWFHQALR